MYGKFQEKSVIGAKSNHINRIIKKAIRFVLREMRKGF